MTPCLHCGFRPPCLCDLRREARSTRFPPSTPRERLTTFLRRVLHR